jgi:hypothetical protein
MLINRITYKLANIDDWYFILFRIGFGEFGTNFLASDGPDAIQVQGRAMKLVHCLVKVAHADFAEITRVARGRRICIENKSINVTIYPLFL